MALDKMQAAWPNDERCRPIVQTIGLTGVRVVPGNATAYGVVQIDLSRKHVCPSRRRRILEIRHEDVRSRVESVDHHFPVGRTSDLDRATQQILRRGRNAPVAVSNVSRRSEKIESLRARGDPRS